MTGLFRGLLLAIVAAALPLAGHAKDKVRVVDSQPLVFDHFALYQALAEGYFDEENLEVEITVGRGGAAALQVALTGNADVVYGAGLLSVVGAYAKGAPITIISNARTGSRDTFWYVKADSPIKSFKDLDGKDLTYSAPGSYTHLFVQTIARELNIKPNFVQTGTMATVRTMVMSGQTDTGWGGVPYNSGMIRSGEARIIGTGDDAKRMQGLSPRGISANSDWLAKNRDVCVRLMRALWKGQVYNFSGEKALRRYAEHWKLDFEDVKEVPKFWTLDEVRYGAPGRFDELLKIAVEYDFVKQPLTESQQKAVLTVVFEAPK